MAFYGAIEQVLTGWIFGLLPRATRSLRARQAAGRGDGLRRARGHAFHPNPNPNPNLIVIGPLDQ